LSHKTQPRKPEHEVKENISPLPVQKISITKAIDKNIHKTCEYDANNPKIATSGSHRAMMLI
jgi:hypothetical protein